MRFRRQFSDAFGVADQFFVHMPGAHNRQAALFQKRQITATIQQRRSIFLQPCLQSFRIRRIRPADNPDASCAPTFDGLAQQKSPTQQDFQPFVYKLPCANANHFARISPNQIGGLFMFLT